MAYTGKTFFEEPPFWGGYFKWTIPYPRKNLKIFLTKLSISSGGPKEHSNTKFTT